MIASVGSCFTGVETTAPPQAILVNGFRNGSIQLGEVGTYIFEKGMPWARLNSDRSKDPAEFQAPNLDDMDAKIRKIVAGNAPGGPKSRV